MSTQTLNLTPSLYEYLLSVSLREHAILKHLREETHELPGFRMQISPEQGQFMALLVQLLGAKKTLDIGTFTGYSALAVALALPNDGEVYSFDIDENVTQLARIYWQEANVDKKIKLFLGNAVDSLQKLLNEGYAGTFDFAFIDADKNNYDAYYEKALVLLRSGGLIAIDNVLWGGDVADPEVQDKQTVAIRILNEKLLHDKRITLSMLPIGDGLTLARKL